MRRWLGPVIVGTILALITYQVTIMATPRLLMAAAHRRVAGGGENRLTFGPLATAASRAIVRPSPDLAYSVCPYNLKKAPLLIDVPAVPSVYWSLSVFDANTDVAFVRNNADTAGKALHVAVMRSAQPVPAGYSRVIVHGATGIALVRILVEDRSKFPTIDAARRAASCHLKDA